MADDVAVVDTPVVDSAPASDSTPVSTQVDTAPAADAAPQPEANDPFAALEAALASELPAEDPAASADPNQPAVPEQFQQALQLSEFVKSPESVQSAVRAADEVWKVATGQLPARNLLEGFKDVSPQQYQTIVQDLTQYIEQVTGKKFGGAPDTPPDPRDERLSAIEQRFQQEEQQRQQQAWNSQVGAATTKARELASTALKGGFADGMEDRFVGPNGLVWAKAGQMQIDEKQMMADLMNGKGEKFNKVMNAVKADEIAILKKYNANLIRKSKNLQTSVPATKGAPSVSTNPALAQKPGETDVQWRTRLWNEGLV